MKKLDPTLRNSLIGFAIIAGGSNLYAHRWPWLAVATTGVSATVVVLNFVRYRKERSENA